MKYNHAQTTKTITNISISNDKTLAVTVLIVGRPPIQLHGRGIPHLLGKPCNLYAKQLHLAAKFRRNGICS